MKKNILMALLVSLGLVLTGCGSGDFDINDGNSSIPGNPDTNGSTPDINATKYDLVTVKPSGSLYIVSQKDHDYEIVLKATMSGNAASNQMIKVVTGKYPGTIAPDAAKTDENGKVAFLYHSPSTLDAIKEAFTVTFAVSEDTRASANVTFKASSGGTDNNQTVDMINYAIKLDTSDHAFNLGLGMKKKATVSLIDRDGNATIDNSRVESIRVTSVDPTVLKMTQQSGGAPAKTVTIPNENNAQIILVADEQNSGLAPLKVTITYYDTNGVKKTLEQTISATVLSGPPTAFSINSDGISYNFDTKQFEHKFIIQAVDNSGNPIAARGIINVSAMASFAKDADDQEILYGRWSNVKNGISASLTSDGGKGKLSLAGKTPFSATTIDQKRAFVAVVGDVNSYEALGKWNIKSIEDSSTLLFSNQYYGGDYSGLGMAVGYNYRDKICSSGYEESVVVVDSSDGTYALNEKGQAFVTLKYDAYMIGKRIAVLVNMIGYDPQTEKFARSGEVKFDTESFVKNLKGDTFSISKDGNETNKTIRGVIDTGTADEYYVRNSTFSCEIKLNKAEIVRDANGNPKIYHNDPASCQDGGIAYLTVTVKPLDPKKDGSITFEKCQVNSEGSF